LGYILVRIPLIGREEEEEGKKTKKKTRSLKHDWAAGSKNMS